jgi:hypothetical protein
MTSYILVDGVDACYLPVWVTFLQMEFPEYLARRVINCLSSFPWRVLVRVHIVE